MPKTLSSFITEVVYESCADALVSTFFFLRVVEGEQYSSTKYPIFHVCSLSFSRSCRRLIINNPKVLHKYLAVDFIFNLCSFEYYIDAEHVREVHFQPVEGKASM